MSAKNKNMSIASTISRIAVVRFHARFPRLLRSMLLLAGMCSVMFLSPGVARAMFHLWAVTEVYSSADGSVQFVELSTSASPENALNGHVITCTGPLGTHSFTFPANLPSSITANKTFLIGTTNLALVPGGVTPDYVFTNSVPFLFLNSGATNTIGITGSFETPAAYTNLPTDGKSSLTGSGSSMVIATSSPKNFNGEFNSIVPVKLKSINPSGNDFILSFDTATGTNGTAGPNYGVEYNNSLTSTNWTTLTNVAGVGAITNVADVSPPDLQRFYRLRVP